MVLLVDIIFLTAAVLVTAAGAVLALMVNMILPGHYWDQSRSGYVPFPIMNMNSGESLDIQWMAVGRTLGDIRNHTYLVSISAYPYLDSKKHCLFLCTGAVVSLDGEVVVLTGSGCNLEHHHNVVVRGGSDFFWKDGKVSKIKSVIHKEGWSILTLEQEVGTAATMNLSEEVPVNSRFYGLGWGAEVRPNIDILGNERFFVETWGTSYEDMCPNSLPQCNYYFFTHQISKFFIEAMDEKLTCCYEAFIVHTKRRTIRNVHGENTGKPLVYFNPEGTPIVIAMQHQIGLRTNDTIGYYTVFNAVAPERDPPPAEEEKEEDEPAPEEDEPITEDDKAITQEMGRSNRRKHKGTKGSKKQRVRVKRTLDKEERGPRLISTRIYKVQSTKKFFLQWFRYSGTKDGEQYANYDPELWKLEKKPWLKDAEIYCYLYTNRKNRIRHDFEMTVTNRPFLP